MLSDLTENLLKATERLHRETCEFEEAGGPYGETVSAWQDSLLAVEKAMGLHDEAAAQETITRVIAAPSSELELEEAKQRIANLESHLQICRLGLLYAGRVHPHPREENYRSVFGIVYQTIHITLRSLWEHDGLSREAYQTTLKEKGVLDQGARPKMVGRIIGKIRVVDEPQHTRNLFGPLSAIAGREIDVLERNDQGDCLCLVDRRYIVDVDHRDVNSDGSE